MFKEISNIKQNEGEPFRRIFNSSDLYMISWFEESQLVSYHLYYKFGIEEFCIIWEKDFGLSFRKVYSGADRPDRHKMTALLIEKDDAFFKQITL